jgi:adenine-specific DNA-methyltransferase
MQAPSSTTEVSVDHLAPEHEQGVRITFSGKNVVRQIARMVRPRVMQRIAKYCVGSPDQQADNLLIEGECLQAMVSLYRYRGRIDLILADPPYNTGNDFRYNDRWDDDPNDPELGELVSEDDGAKHTKWLRFMWPRLKTMHEMLKPTGVLAICIDYRELFSLGSMLDEIFLERNRLAIINWQKTTPKNQDDHVTNTTEYVLVYAKDKELATTGLEERSKKADRRFGRPDGDEFLWKQGDLTARGPQKGSIYSIQSPFTGELHDPDIRHWARNRTQMKEWAEAWGSKYEWVDVGDAERGKALVLKGWRPGRDSSNARITSTASTKARKRLLQGSWPLLYWRHDGMQQPVKKVYKEAVKQGAVPQTFWLDEDDFVNELGPVAWPMNQSGRSRDGVEELDQIVGRGHGFDTVKPLKLFSKIVQLWCKPDGLVLDPFAGSGTTGHAVLALNEASEAERSFILIEQGRRERNDPYARSLTANRLRRVISGGWSTGHRDELGGGFAFYTLKSNVDARAVLEMERDLMADTVIASYFDASRRGVSSLVRMSECGCRYLVAKNAAGEGFYLIWDGANKSPVLDATAYEVIVTEAQAMGLAPLYHVYARFNLYQSDDIRFYQIPNRILVDFGLSVANDAFNNTGNSNNGATANVEVA